MSVSKYSETQCLLSAAYHEAGHAVILVSFGQKIIKIEIRPDGGGYTQSSNRLTLHEQIMVLQAGSACLEVFNIPSPDTGGAERDYAEVVTMLDGHLADATGEEKDKLENRLRQKTFNFFEDPAVKIGVEALVSELVQHRSMTGIRAHQVLDPIFSSINRTHTDEVGG